MVTWASEAKVLSSLGPIELRVVVDRSPNMPHFGLFEKHGSSDGQERMQKARCMAVTKFQKESPRRC